MFVSNTKTFDKMEEKKRSVLMNAINFGAIAGGVSIVYHLLLFIAGLHLNKALGWIGILLLFALMIWGTLDFRKKNPGGFITFGQAFQCSFLIGLFTGILYTIYFFVFVNFIDPGFVNEIVEQARKAIEEQNNLTPDQVEQAMIWTRKMTGPVMMVVSSFLQYTIFSLILALISALILKKNDPSAQTTI